MTRIAAVVLFLCAGPCAVVGSEDLAKVDQYWAQWRGPSANGTSSLADPPVDPDGSRVTIHQLRHAFGSERAGKVDALVLRDLMGHKSLQTTLRYAEVSPKRTREAFRQFDRETVRR